MYKAVTRGIRVTVMPRFVEEESSPEQNQYFFAYTVEITNMTTERVQLRSRYWRIIDGNGKLQEVRGAGVVGEQPVLAPGRVHEYRSFCVLKSPRGHMEGQYRFVRPDGSRFEAQIPRFLLDAGDGAAA